MAIKRRQYRAGQHDNGLTPTDVMTLGVRPVNATSGHLSVRATGAIYLTNSPPPSSAGTSSFRYENWLNRSNV
jgi:hypothetical protein